MEPNSSDLLLDLLGRHARKLHPQIERIGTHLARGRRELLRHLARPVAHDRLVVTERARWRGVALVDGPLTVDQPGRHTAEPHSTNQNFGPLPLGVLERPGQAGQSRRCRHSFHQDPGPAPGSSNGGGDRHGRAEHRNRISSAGEKCRVSVELPEVLTAEHRDEPRQFRFEAIDRIGLADANRLEVHWEGACGHSKSDTASMPSLEPRDLLGNERRGPERKQEWCRRGPAGRMLGQHERGHLQRLRHVSGKAAVVLARHDPVESTG